MSVALRALLVLATAAPLLGGCVIYAKDQDDVSVRIGDRTTTASSEPLESLRAFRFDADALVVRVDSGGCTTTASFAVEVGEGNPVDLTLTRNTPDACEAMIRDGVELRWTYADLGLKAGQTVVVRNPVRLP